METFFILIVAALWMIAFKLPGATPPAKPQGPPPGQYAPPNMPTPLPPQMRQEPTPIYWQGQVYIPYQGQGMGQQGPPQIQYRPGGWMQ